MSATTRYHSLRRRYEDGDESAGKMLASAYSDMVDEQACRRAAMTPEQRAAADAKVREIDIDTDTAKHVGRNIGQRWYDDGHDTGITGIDHPDADIVTRSIMVDAANVRLRVLAGTRVADAEESERRQRLLKALHEKDSLIFGSLCELIGDNSISVAHDESNAYVPTCDTGRKLAELLGRSEWTKDDILKIQAAQIKVSLTRSAPTAKAW